MLQKLQVDLESAQQAKQRLETDNLALYSKIKYLQSYNSSGNTYKSPQVHTKVVVIYTTYSYI